MLDLLKEVSTKYNQKQTGEVEAALAFCNSLKNSSSIYNHNFGEGIAEILLNIFIDHNTIIAGLLFPHLKRNVITLEQLTKQKAVSADVIHILTQTWKIEELKINTRETAEQHIKDMFIALAKDIRVIILKLAIEYQKTKVISKYKLADQERHIYEVEEIFAPLAAMLGIGYIKNGLERAVFMYTKPKEYEELSKQLNVYVEERNKQIQLSIEKIKKELGSHIKADISGRQKQLTSIYKKMQYKTKKLNQILDILAVRILVDTIEECYYVLGKIHGIYSPMGNFKDYISQPKENGYQSLHTTVVVENGDPLEIQIRTRDMHTYAEFGFAAHWAYKQHRKVNESDQKLSYVRSVMDLYKDKSSEELLDALKTDVYSGKIFVQSPMGKVLQLPEGATPIDFAYDIHTNVGNTCIGAKINGRMVPIATPLKNGDVVEIITNPNSRGPNRDWLKLVKTSSARNKINTFFKKEMKEENIKKGKSMLDASAKAKGYPLARLMVEKYLTPAFKRYSLLSLDDMYASFGYGGLNPNQILNKLYMLYADDEKIDKPIKENQLSINPVISKKAGENVNISGFSAYTKMAQCCNPLPGDDIIGYITRGSGITVHRENCEALKGYEAERLIGCTWNQEIEDYFVGVISVKCVNAPNSLSGISKLIGEMKVNIVGLNTKNVNAASSVLTIQVKVKHKKELSELMNKINQLSVVEEVYRNK